MSQLAYRDVLVQVHDFQEIQVYQWEVHKRDKISLAQVQNYHSLVELMQVLMATMLEVTNFMVSLVVTFFIIKVFGVIIKLTSSKQILEN